MTSLLRNAAKSSRSIQACLGNQRLSSLLRDTSRRFTTEAGAPPPRQPQRGNFPPRPIPDFEPNGKVYGRINSIGRFTTKSDIIAMMGDSNLTSEDIKFDYNITFNGNAAVMQFPSQADYSAAVRAVTPKTTRQGGLYKVDRIQWENLKSYDGKSILLQGIPRNAQMDDVERFLSGCQYDISSVSMFSRTMQPRYIENQEAIRMAVVNFPSRASASHAFITKNRGFCLNSQIAIRVLH
ncbi:uncharacterized protein LOC116015476 [Ipomoea triloba]|uniref:uncharacterized protein LOC116015476 n=1 Tax=Ipomoea triloba TaxID=35885 RepID=UPI00125D5169|nr:uncharacterized protein LOC116015476 [Ipomoea triloba]